MSRTSRNLWSCWHVDAAGVSACLGLTLLLYIGGLTPLLHKHHQNVRQRAELEDSQTRATKLAAAADKLARRLKTLGQALDEAPIQLQTPRQLNQRLANLTSLATQCGLAIDQTNSDRPHSSTWHQTVPIRLAGEGTYPTCAVFLDRLRRTFPDTGVSAFDLSGKPDDRAAEAKFQFDLVWYTEPTLSSAQP